MSVPRRAYDLLRSYIGREYERIQGVDTSATKEFQDAMNDPTPVQPVQQFTRSQAGPPADRKTEARSVLGVAEGSDFATIHAAYLRLNRRSDPKNFPPGSSEAKQAREIQRRVQDAYRVLAADADATEVRFRSLEID